MVHKDLADSKRRYWSMTCSFGSNSGVLLVCPQLPWRQKLNDVRVSSMMAFKCSICSINAHLRNCFCETVDSVLIADSSALLATSHIQEVFRFNCICFKIFNWKNSLFVVFICLGIKIEILNLQEFLILLVTFLDRLWCFC